MNGESIRFLLRVGDLPGVAAAKAAIERAQSEATFNIRPGEEKWARIDALIRLSNFLETHHGLCAGAMVRMLLKKEENEVRARPTKPRVKTAFTDPCRPILCRPRCSRC
jgi:hypothetical protein